MRLSLLRGGTPSETTEEAPRAGDDLAPVALAARRGGQGAIRTLVSAVGPAILKVARRVLGARHPDIEDVAQESATGFLAALAGFRGECSTLHFACRIAVLTALKRRRADAARGADATVDVGPDDLAPDLVSDLANAPGARSPLVQLIAARRRDVLRALLLELPEAQAEALVMHLLLGHSIEEIGAAVGAPGNTVRSRLRLGKEALRARIAADPRLDELLRHQEAP